VGFFRSDLIYFLKIPYYLKPSSILQATMSLSVEKGDGIGNDSCNTPKIWESICQGVSVLAIGSQEVSVLATRPSRGDGQGMNCLLLGLYVWPLDEADWGEVWV